MRLAAIIVAPVIFFALLELVLRLAGFGYPTAFLLPSLQNGRRAFVQNYQFGWRFFGEHLSRRPLPLLLSQPEAPGTVRVFVFGESAAYGDPRPPFGLPRMLEAMLNLRYPGVRFEVENAAMTAIDSHVILPIARDCARAGGDLWVIYMGNNEVVGPYGAGTIFGPQAPPLPLIRASLWLKSSRTGELLDSVRQWVQKPPSEKNQWSGMEMFINQQVSADDPRMSRVYHHFGRNLADILEVGRRSGAGIVLSTVAVNLKDCPPLASAHRPGLSGADKSRWEELYERGAKAADAGSNQVAAERFQDAAKIDDRFAELLFRQGQCALALGKIPEAQEDFRAARDLDTLRFRCDSRLNGLIRQAAAGREQDRIRLADAEQAFSRQSQDGLPGEDFFYEHVHLTFEGNYLLAQTIADQLQQLLPSGVTAHGAQAWPSPTECARRLAWSDYTHAEALRQMLARVTQPPFPGQLGHEARTQRLQASLEKLAPAMEPAGMKQAIKVCEQALTAAPDDPLLYAQLAFLKLNTGDLAGAAECVHRQTELLPNDPEAWAQLGLIAVHQRRLGDAATAFSRALELDPTELSTALNHANVLAMLGRLNDAIREYRHMAETRPSFSPAWIALGEIYAEKGRREEAEEYYQKALANNVDVTQAATMARFCQSRGWLEAASTNFQQALKLEPANPMLRLAAGKNLMDLQRYEPAAEQFRAVMRLTPELPEPRVCLGIVLMQEGRHSEAAAQFEEVLRRDPTNTLVLEYSESLRAKPGPEKAR
jgi:tetratricopeptide (TPR) repeat protein